MQVAKGLEPVLEKLATAEKSALVVERAPTSGCRDGEKVILKDQVPEICNQFPQIVG